MWRERGTALLAKECAKSIREKRIDTHAIHQTYFKCVLFAQRPKMRPMTNRIRSRCAADVFIYLPYYTYSPICFCIFLNVVIFSFQNPIGRKCEARTVFFRKTTFHHHHHYNQAQTGRVSLRLSYSPPPFPPRLIIARSSNRRER